MSRLVPASPFSSVNPTEAPSFAGQGSGRTTVNILRASGRSASAPTAPMSVQIWERAMLGPCGLRLATTLHDACTPSDVVVPMLRRIDNVPQQHYLGAHWAVVHCHVSCAPSDMLSLCLI